MIVLTTRKQQIVNEYGINTTFTEEQSLFLTDIR